MHADNDIAIPIPELLVEQLAAKVADKLMLRLKPYLDRIAAAPKPQFESELDMRPPVTFLRLNEVVDRVGVARGTIYKWMSEGRFPQSVKLGGRSVAWRRVDVERWESSPEAFAFDSLSD